MQTGFINVTLLEKLVVQEYNIQFYCINSGINFETGKYVHTYLIHGKEENDDKRQAINWIDVTLRKIYSR